MDLQGVVMSVEKFKPYTDGKIKHEVKPYTVILNKPLQHCDNLEAIGLWTHFQTLPEDWIISPSYIQNKFNIGKDKVYKILNYLIKVNLLSRERLIDAQGKHIETIYVIRNGEDYKPLSEISEAVNPLPDLPLPVLPLPVNQDTTNKTRITNENTEREMALLSENFVFDQKTIHDITEMRDLSPDDRYYEHQKFMAYHISNEIRKPNWNQALLHWMLNAAQFKTNKLRAIK